MTSRHLAHITVCVFVHARVCVSVRFCACSSLPAAVQCASRLVHVYFEGGACAL